MALNTGEHILKEGRKLGYPLRNINNVTTHTFNMRIITSTILYNINRRETDVKL